MTELINRFTGTKMWVADNRVEEYLAAGHKRPAPAEKPAEEPEVKTRGRKKRG